MPHHNPRPQRPGGIGFVGDDECKQRMLRILGLGREISIVEGFGPDDQSVIFASAGKVARIVAVKRAAAADSSGLK
jgi:hypothetical protein